MAIRAILCTDGSEASRRTLTFTLRMARALPLEVTLVHALGLPRLQYKMIPDFQVEMIQQRARDAGKALLEKERGRMEEAGVGVTTRLLDGTAAATLGGLAEEEGADLVILGRRGQSDLTDILFGSVSSHLIQNCSRPVLVVQHDRPPVELPEEGTPLRCLVAVDGSEASLRCVDHLTRFAEAAEGLQVTLLKVVNPQRPGLEHLNNEDRYETLAQMHRDAHGVLDRAADPLRRLGFTVETRVEEGAAGKTVCSIGQEDSFDLTLLGRRGLGQVAEVLFGSVSHYVVHHCPGNVLIVP